MACNRNLKSFLVVALVCCLLAAFASSALAEDSFGNNHLIVKNLSKRYPFAVTVMYNSPNDTETHVLRPLETWEARKGCEIIRKMEVGMRVFYNHEHAMKCNVSGIPQEHDFTYEVNGDWHGNPPYCHAQPSYSK